MINRPVLINDPEVSAEYLQEIMAAVGATQPTLAVLVDMSQASVVKFMYTETKAAKEGRKKCLAALSDAFYTVWTELDPIAVEAVPKTIKDRIQLIKKITKAVGDNKYYVAKGQECPNPAFLNGYGVFKHQAFLFDL